MYLFIILERVCFRIYQMINKISFINREKTGLEETQAESKEVFT